MSFLNGRVNLWRGDCLDILAGFEENSFDSCVTDPPYHLTQANRSKPAPFVDNPFGRSRVGYNGDVKPVGGFMGKEWDGGDIAFRPETWAQVLRTLKPGAHLVAFAAPKNAHRMFCAIEDAGFEIRDTLAWLFGSGFPKSHDVSKGIDRAVGGVREKVRHENPRNPKATGGGRDGMEGATRPWIERAMEVGYHELDSDIPATEAARQWEGWGTALKPAHEPICLARKPLSEKTIAANVLRWGTGALNIDACRVTGAFESGWSKSGSKASENVAMSGANYARDPKPDNASGRWPANVIHDGSDEVVEAFPFSASGTGAVKRATGADTGGNRGSAFGAESRPAGTPMICHGDEGSASRFFYTAKADADDRIGSKHPTVKPLDLMQYLCRLVTPPRGKILDPFAGTGTTGEAAWREGFSAHLIEREPEYQADIERRMSLALAGPDERARESIKARLVGKPDDHGPLFAGAAA